MVYNTPLKTLLKTTFKTNAITANSDNILNHSSGAGGNEESVLVFSTLFCSLKFQ